MSCRILNISVWSCYALVWRPWSAREVDDASHRVRVDVISRLIMEWSIADHLRTETTGDALDIAR